MAERKIVAGNWKMNGLAPTAWRWRAPSPSGRGQPHGCELLVCPPVHPDRAVGEALAGSGVAARRPGLPCRAEGRVHRRHQRRDAGGRRLQPRDRRPLRAPPAYGETDADVARKAAGRAGAPGSLPIVCVGETLAEREAGRALASSPAQLAGLAAGRRAARRPRRRLRAGLGDRHRPDPDHADDRRDARADPRRLAERLAEAGAGAHPLRRLGEADNAAEILAVAEVDGALVGGASLKADDSWRSPRPTDMKPLILPPWSVAAPRSPVQAAAKRPRPMSGAIRRAAPSRQSPTRTHAALVPRRARRPGMAAPCTVAGRWA